MALRQQERADPSMTAEPVLRDDPSTSPVATDDLVNEYYMLLYVFSFSARIIGQIKPANSAVIVNHKPVRPGEKRPRTFDVLSFSRPSRSIFGVLGDGGSILSNG